MNAETESEAGLAVGKGTQRAVYDVPMESVEVMLELAGVFSTWIGEDFRKKTDEI